MEGWGAGNWTHGSPERLVHLYKKGVKIMRKRVYVTFSTTKLRLSRIVKEKSRIFSAFLGFRKGFLIIEKGVIKNYAVLTTPSWLVWETRRSLSTTSTFKSKIRIRKLTYSKAFPKADYGSQVLS